MSVWYCIPSKRPAEEAEKCLSAWRERGYKIALWLDGFREMVDQTKINYWINGGNAYPGYSEACNFLIKEVLLQDESCDWVVTGGDDVYPDPNKTADEIARECTEHFSNAYLLGAGKIWPSYADCRIAEVLRTFGIMQPTGDRWGDHERHMGKTGSAYIDRVCGSPWIGREFARRMYGGRGPYWPEFTHMFCDEHLQCVAQKLGVLWQRPDLIHFHNHDLRKRGNVEDLSVHALRWNTPEHWRESKAIMERLRAGGFAEANDLLP